MSENDKKEKEEKSKVETSTEPEPEVIAKKINYDWSPLKFSYDEKNEYLEVKKEDDPLQASKVQNFADPLRMDFSKKIKFTASVSLDAPKVEEEVKLLNWKQRKESILSEYRTDKKLPIYSSILFGHVDEENISFENKIKQRLSMLSTDNDKKSITQKKYIKFLEELDEELKKAWNKNNDRVHALKIVIKCTKMLSKTLVPEFYPSMFVIVCEVMDTFGRLVFDRIKSKSTVKDRYSQRVTFRLPDDFNTAQVPSRAKEICKNWFFKISSIRELIARVYVEIMIVHSRKFLYFDYKKEMKEELMRLTLALRGIGDPLVSNYARFYLAKKGSDVLPDETEYLLVLYEDFFKILSQMEEPYFQNYLSKTSLTKQEYLRLLIPPGEWIVEAIGRNANEEIYKKVLKMYLEKAPRCTFILNAIIKSFPSKFIANDCYKFIGYLKEYDNPIFAQYKIIKSLGKQFTIKPPREKKKLDILNIIWKIVRKYEDLVQYLLVAEVYVEYIVKKYTLKEVNIILKDIHEHILPNKEKLGREVEIQLQSILLCILTNCNDIISLFDMEFFLPIFDLLKADVRIEVSKGLLGVLQRNKSSFESNPVILNSLFDLSKIVGESVNFLSPPAVWKEVEDLIHGFIKSVEFSEDAYEKQLDFYIEARKAFPNFDKVYELLCNNTNKIIMILANDEESKKGRVKNFIKTAQSFLHITLPSIRDPLKRLSLSLTTAHICLYNNLVPQAEEILKSCINNIVEIPQFSRTDKNMIVSNEDELIDVIARYSSTLVCVPGHPRFGPFFLIKTLLNQIEKYDWEKKSCGKLRAYLTVLKSLGPLFHTNLQFKYENILIQNLDLFDDTKIKKEAKLIAQTVLTQIDTNIEIIKKSIMDLGVLKKLQWFCVELLNYLCFQTTINKQIIEMMNECYKLSKGTQNNVIKAFFDNTIYRLKKKNLDLYMEISK